MIICTEHTLAVGEHVIGPVTDPRLDWHTVAFVVLRQATEEEYRRHAANYVDSNPPFDKPVNFYVVAMD